MQEINNARQKSSTRRSKKLFKIHWSETLRCYAIVKARNEKEAIELFHERNSQVWENVRFEEREQTSGPWPEEVEEA